MTLFTISLIDGNFIQWPGNSLPKGPLSKPVTSENGTTVISFTRSTREVWGLCNNGNINLMWAVGVSKELIWGTQHAYSGFEAAFSVAGLLRSPNAPKGDDHVGIALAIILAILASAWGLSCCKWDSYFNPDLRKVHPDSTRKRSGLQGGSLSLQRNALLQNTGEGIGSEQIRAIEELRRLEPTCCRSSGYFWNRLRICSSFLTAILSTILVVFTYNVIGTANINWKSFGLHPILMVLSFGCMSQISVASYRLFEHGLGCSHYCAKSTHGLLHMAALVTGTVGIWNMYLVHDATCTPNRKSPCHFLTLHSWIGLAAWGLYGLAFVAGAGTYYNPNIEISTKIMLMNYHKHVGTVVLLLTSIAIFSGFLVFNGAVDYFNDENGMMANISGIVVIATAITTYLATRGLTRQSSKNEFEKT